ncbi:MAG: SdrD B-like domain-containing protein, partial [Planctomycetaceae bacterium]|nr:SdrD B-like domain-containing protein [Planctomycetaceae bacterium]
MSGSRSVALKNGGNVGGLDFGNYTLQESTIRGTIFADSDQDGTRDAGERGLSGITVYLDANNNGVMDAGEARTTTSSDQFYTPTADETGTYSFTHLAQGSYTVRSLLPETLSATPPAELTHSVTIAATEDHSGIDTAAVFRPNEIHGVKFDDTNGNHLRDAGEAGVGGVTIYLDIDRDDVQDPIEPQTTTAADGSYSFGMLTAGAYVVREVLPAGHEHTYPLTSGGTLWPSGVSNAAVGNVTPSNITTSLAAGQTHRETVSITLPNTGALTNLVDVFLLFDDTGSFVNNSPIVRGAFPAIISQLQAALPGTDLGFGVGRFEEYANFAYEYATGRPFILNQPIVAASTPGYMSSIQAALDRTTPGYGGDQPETDIEALYQLVTGVGFDGNNNGSVLDSGASGLASTQLNPGNSGDVPSFASFLADPAHSVMSAAGNIGGGGFRAGALPIILTATDTGFAYQPMGETNVTGAGGVTLPVSALTGTDRPTTPFNSGAGLQETVTALNALGALVIGLGTNPQANLDPRQGLEALSTLTGATNHSTTTIANGTSDAIAPGDPLYFQIASGFAGSVADGVVSAIRNAATNVAVDITVQASDPRVRIVNHSGVKNGIGSGQTATFDIEIVGDGTVHRFDLQFVRAGTNVVLGSIPVVLGTPIPGEGYEFEDCAEGEIHHSVDFGSHETGVVTSTMTVSGGTYVYDGMAHAATATVTGTGGTPVSGNYAFTYNGLTSPPTNAGVYDVVATFTSSDPKYADVTGTATQTVTPSTPSVTVIACTVTFDGSPHAATATAVGVGGVAVSGTYTFSYNGSTSLPTAVGSYDVVASFTSSDPNYANAIGTATLLITAPA